jgi:glycosyltransferase involved in cell wall biosynthesis
MGRCRALVYAAEEDFGMVYVEALAAGAPVVAYGRGGIRDVYRMSDGWLTDGQGRVVGVSFETQSAAAVVEAVGRLERAQCTGHGGQVLGRFGGRAFEAAIRKVLSDLPGSSTGPDSVPRVAEVPGTG